MWRYGASLLVVLLLGVTGCGDDETDSAAGSVPCGPATCSEGQYCCDAACGLCEQTGIACPGMCQ
jgi:hypothetical protein